MEKTKSGPSEGFLGKPKVQSTPLDKRAPPTDHRTRLDPCAMVGDYRRGAAPFTGDSGLPVERVPGDLLAHPAADFPLELAA